MFQILRMLQVVCQEYLDKEIQEVITEIITNFENNYDFGNNFTQILNIILFKKL